jgi:CheY-like chemotaxis protein
MNNDNKNCVLIVDDEKLNIEVLSDILQPEYTVLMAKNGGIAIEILMNF